MQPTPLGLVVVLLGLAVLSQPVRLLQLTLVSALFEAASLVVIGGAGGFGVQLATGPALLFLGHVGLQYALGMRYPGEARVLRTIAPLLPLLVYAGASALLLPDMFTGRVMVWPQKFEFFDQGAVALRPDGSNLNQCVYLLLNTFIVTLSALFLSRGAVDYRGLLRAYLLSGYIVVGLSVWQLGARVAGLPFPADLLYTNPGWLVLTEQTLGGMPRINGPFSEPSALASYLCGIAVCSLWLCVRGHQVMAPRLLLALAVVTVFLSTSTTGIVVVVTVLPLVLLFALGRGDRRGIRQAGATLGALLCGAVFTLLPLMLLRPELLDILATILEGTLEKGSSDSFAERTTADGDALRALAATWGLGVGWGMFRSSSLLPGLLANGGLPGILLLLVFAQRVAALARRAAAAAPGHPGRLAIDGFAAAICGQLAAALVSGPIIVSPAFYMQLGGVIGISARLLGDARPALAARRRPAWAGPQGVAP
jgi:hypothetical protein